MIKKIRQLRFRAENRDIFEAIKDGRKTVETRAASPKFSDIKAGDIIVLKCGRERIEKLVKKATIFKNVESLIKKYKISQIHPGVNSFAELGKKLVSFPGYREKIKKYGLIALEI